MDLLTPAVKPPPAPRHRRSAGLPPAPREGGTRLQAAARERREPATTPARIRVMALVAAALAVALAALLTFEVRRERGGLEVIGRQTAPVVMASSDLYFALGDMDAQLANILLVGNDTGLGFTRGDALKIYQERRGQVSQALQRASETADADPEAARAVRDILDGLGRYETLAAQMVLLDEQESHPAGRPTASTLAKYREATDLLKAVLLPAAQGLIDRNSQILEETYQRQRGLALTVRTWLMAVGILLLAALFLLQVYVSRRFHRWLNPALALATLIAAVLVLSGHTLTTNGAEYLRVAKKDSFDSVLALNRARAVSYDANADESRYLLDPQRAGQYEKAFLDKTLQLVALDGATLSTFDERLSAAQRAYRADRTAIEWQGFYGKGFRNITFVGERELAEKTLETYQVYQVDDRQIRQLASGGRLRSAIAFCTSYNPGDSNYHFSEYDKALSAWIDMNEGWFERSIRDGERQLAGWTVIPAVAAVLVLGLLALGLRRRLAEYHRSIG
ncbi:hypothetical protein RB614_11835 [Phytohabitans sp. ZYX-F-186]|uniref:DUF4239 domain-containing protein n=1 Tax=Phytohabitans maris TaxID=3071409 RepID=A0ABU0ZFP7_9ACTN|nr:hypothetical protein [Phytohabitans sp. ZYX-F-186]MDQ7905214.1 hypothetical protein [Phytohabitans sp. ZYX-F-186]